MRTSNSGIGHGTNGSPQTSLEQQLTETVAKKNEEAVAEKLTKPYDLQTLPNSSPPSDSIESETTRRTEKRLSTDTVQMGSW